jgi:serine/threonine protein kinase
VPGYRLTCHSIYEKLGGAIGKGTYGEVFMAIDKVIQTRLYEQQRSGAPENPAGESEYVALKRIMIKDNEEFPFTSAREIKLLQGLQHNNIVRLREVVSSGLLRSLSLCPCPCLCPCLFLSLSVYLCRKHFPTSTQSPIR